MPFAAPILGFRVAGVGWVVCTEILLMNAAPQRLFVSLALPEPCRAVVMKLYDRIEGAAWTCPEQLHLTMRFLGDVEVDLSARIEMSLAKIRVNPFLLPLEAVQRFPPRGPAKVLAVGIGRGHTLLFNSARRLMTPCWQRAGVGTYAISIHTLRSRACKMHHKPRSINGCIITRNSSAHFSASKIFSSCSARCNQVAQSIRCDGIFRSALRERLFEVASA
jgi:2'-5' RNA ligase